MTFIEAVSTCLFEYANFEGRATRQEFWWFMLAVALALTAAGFADAHLFGHPVIFWIVALALVVPSLAAGSRRLHDSDRSGWWQLLFLFPVFGAILVLTGYIARTSELANDHGPVPGSSR